MDFLRQLYRNLSDIEGLIYTRAQASEIRIIIEQIEDETQALKAQTLRLKDQLSSKSDECQVSTPRHPAS